MVYFSGRSWPLFQLLYTGSITHVTDRDANLKQELSYDAWGRLRNPANHQVYAADTESKLYLGRGYTGHEHLAMYGLINMNARLYDAALGRFLSPDPYVQAADWSQNFNRYSYAMNNPLRYTDPSGKLFFVPVLAAMAVGALIGAGTAIVAYSLGCLITGVRWDFNACLDATVMGAIGGAIGGGISAAGGAFANSFGYNMISQAAGNVMTSVIFGNKISLSLGSVAGMVAGGLISTYMPQYNAIKGSWIKNLSAEVGINTGRGAVSGAASGITEALIDGKDSNIIIQKMVGGAVNGASNTLATNALFGTGKYRGESSTFSPKRNKAVDRLGGLVTLSYKLFAKGYSGGINLGRTAYSSKDKESLFNHEGTHWQQQQEDGFGIFYGKTVANYISSIITQGSIDALYDASYNGEIYRPGNYEDIATQVEKGILAW